MSTTITAAVATHHHEDHAGGLRQFAAAGVTAVVHEAAADFFAHIFDAPATIGPDMMVDAGEVSMETVPADGMLELADATHVVEIYPIAQTHAEDMIIAYVADPGIVFVSDLYSPHPDADALGTWPPRRPAARTTPAAADRPASADDAEFPAPHQARPAPLPTRVQPKTQGQPATHATPSPLGRVAARRKREDWGCQDPDKCRCAWSPPGGDGLWAATEWGGNDGMLSGRIVAL